MPKTKLLEEWLGTIDKRTKIDRVNDVLCVEEDTRKLRITVSTVQIASALLATAKLRKRQMDPVSSVLFEKMTSSAEETFPTITETMSEYAGELTPESADFVLGFSRRARQIFGRKKERTPDEERSIVGEWIAGVRRAMTEEDGVSAVDFECVFQHAIARSTGLNIRRAIHHLGRMDAFQQVLLEDPIMIQLVSPNVN
jgi:hypothetical protein